MRKYVRQQELVKALNDLVTHRSPDLIKVYQDVMYYRFCKQSHPENRQRTERMLMIPRRLTLRALNCLASLIVIPFLPAFFFRLQMSGWYSEAVFVLAIFSGIEAWKCWKLFCLWSACKPYILIDELIARKIIVLSVNKTPSEKPEPVKR